MFRKHGYRRYAGLKKQYSIDTYNKAHVHVKWTNTIKITHFILHIVQHFMQIIAL